MAFHYQLTPYIAKTLSEVDYIVDFLNFFTVSPKASATISMSCDEERFQKYIKLLSKDAKLSSDYSRSGFVNAQLQAEKYLLAISGNITIKNLKKAHEILVRRTQYEEQGGVFWIEKNQSNLSLQENYDGLSQADIEVYLKKFLRFLNATSARHPIVKPWLVYYFFDLIRPFEKMNYAFGLLLLRVSIQKNYPSIPWFLEKFILENWEPHLSSVSSGLFAQNFNSRYGQDLTPFVQNCLELTLRNLNWVKEMTTTFYFEEKALDLKDPRKRNSLNFLIDQGFKLNHRKIAELNERQQSLLEQVALHRDVNTKLMVQTFRCDRKTIQRDFAEIMKFDLVKQEGKTKTVRYCVNFSSLGHKIASTENISTEAISTDQFTETENSSSISEL